MVSLKSFVVILGLSTSVFAKPPARWGSRDAAPKSTVYEKVAAPPVGWTQDKDQKLDKDATTIKLRIHLIQQDMDKFHEMALNIATPGHKLYGNHLSQHVIDAMISPKQESKELVMQWLENAGLKEYASLSPRADSVIVETTLAKVEKLLKTEYSAFFNAKTGEKVARTLEYSLPSILTSHVDSIQPTTFFGLRNMGSMIKDFRPNIAVPSANVLDTAAVKGCSGSSITPTCLANLYNFANSTSTSLTAGRMGIAGFLEQHPVMTDLTSFMSKYAYYANKNEKYTCELINKGTCPTTDTQSNIIEANLDVQYARAITQNIPNVYYSTAGSPPWLGSGTNTNEPYLEFLNYLLALPDAQLPNTLSISYGDDESTVPLSYATSTCNLFAQLGARGVSVLAASGDDGVGSTCQVAGKSQFTTLYPAACPWVTAVGGTTGTSPEGAWSYGGGGFSEVFGRPSYQNATVNTWLSTDKTHTSYSSYFNASGRAYPDISAQSTNYLVYILGSAGGVSGTSASTPTVASVMQLLSSERIAAGKKGLGFLNPWLYGAAASGNGFNDVTTGKIVGCSNSPAISGAGFSAVAGWDPATGLGTPNYGTLLGISNAT
ncbi:peptidase S8/S53 domain-containing protein [Halenospora varia]|nr:peptidase S8/S53 domain-containing protein [Halenospora varia]